MSAVKKSIRRGGSITIKVIHSAGEFLDFSPPRRIDFFC